MKEMFVFEPIYFNAESIAIGQQQNITRLNQRSRIGRTHLKMTTRARVFWIGWNRIMSIQLWLWNRKSGYWASNFDFLVVLVVHSAVSYQLTCTLWGQTYWRNKQVSCQPPSTNSTTSSLKKISSDVMHPHVSNLPGHLLQVLLVVHGVVDHQPSCTWCVEKQIESKKTLISTTITTAYHILVNENFNWCDTSYCQRPPWSSPPCCPCRPQCRPPPNNMSKK